MPLAIPKHWLPQLPSDQAPTTAPPQFDPQYANTGDVPVAAPSAPTTFANTGDVPFAQGTPQTYTPQYGDDYVDASSGSLRAQLEAKRRGKDYLLSNALPAAAIGLAAAPVTAAAGAGLAGATSLPGGGLLAQGLVGTAAARPVSEAVQAIPGYESLPQPAQYIAENAPYAAAGRAKLPVKVGEAVLGGLGMFGGSQLDEELGTPQLPLVGGPLAALAGGLGGTAPHLAAARKGVKPKDYKGRVAAMLDDEDLDPAVAEMIGLTPKTTKSQFMRDRDALSKEGSELQISSVDGRELTIRNRGADYAVFDEQGTLVAKSSVLHDIWSEITGRDASAPNVIDQALDPNYKQPKVYDDRDVNYGVGRLEDSGSFVHDVGGDAYDFDRVKGTDTFIVRGPDDTVIGEYKVGEGGVRNAFEDIQRSARETQDMVDVDLYTKLYDKYRPMSIPDLYNERDKLLRRATDGGMLSDPRSALETQRDALNELARVEEVIAEKTGRKTTFGEAVQNVDEYMRRDPNIEYLNAGFNPFPTINRVLNKLALRDPDATRPFTPAMELPPLRDLPEIANEIVQNGASDPLTRSLLRTLNPSSDATNPVQNVIIANQRQLVESEGYINNLLRSYYDAVSFSNDMRSVFKVNKNGLMRVKNLDNGALEYVEPATAMEFPDRYEMLSGKATVARQRALDIIQMSEDYLVNQGVMTPSMIAAAKANLEPGQVYWPRVFKTVHDVAIEGKDIFGRPDLPRTHGTAAESGAAGNVTVGVRETLQSHLRWVYAQHANSQLSEHLAQHGIKPSELLTPEMQLRVQRDTAEFIRAKRAQRLEAEQTQRLYKEMSGKDVKAATRELNLAKRELTRVQGEIAGMQRRVAKPSANDSPDLAQAKRDWSIANQELTRAEKAVSRAQGRRERSLEIASTRRREQEGIKHSMDTSIRVKGKDVPGETPSQIAIADANTRLATAKEAAETADKALREQIRIDRQNGLANRSSRMPVAMGKRLTEAKARITAAELTLKDANTTATSIPRGKAGAQNFVSDATLAATSAAAKRFYQTRKASAAQTSALSSAHQVPSAFFDPIVVAKRKALQEATDNHNDQVAYTKGIGGNIYNDPSVVGTRQTMKDAYDAYHHEYINAKNAAPDAKTSVEMWQGRGGGKLFPKEQIASLENGLRKMHGEGGPWAKTAKAFADARRTLTTGFDFGAPFIHGLPVLANNPRAWANMVGHQYRDFADPQNLAHFMQDHYDTVQKMAKYELTTVGSEFYEGMKGSSALEKYFPPTRRFALSYEGALQAARVMMWESMEESFMRGGIMSRAGTEAELAQYIRNMTGGMDTRALGIGGAQRAFESTWVALSPRLLRSTLALIADLRGLNPGDILRGQADPIAMRSLVSLSRLAGTALGMYYLTGKALGIEDEDILNGMKPWEGKRFLSHKIGDQWYGVGGMVRSVSQLLGGIYSGVAPDKAFGVDIGGEKPFSDLYSASSRNPLINFFISRGAPGLAIAATGFEGATGVNATGFEQVDGLPGLAEHLFTDNLPFVVQGVMEGSDALGTVTAMGGLRTSPTTPSEDYYETIDEVVIPELIRQGQLDPSIQTSADLGFGESNLVSRYIAANYPELSEEYKKYRKQLGSIFQEKQDQRQVIEDRYKNEIDDFYQQLITGNMKPKDVFDALSSVRSTMRGEVKTLYDDPEYKAKIANLESNNMEKLADDYFKLFDEVAKGATTLNADQWDELATKQEQFITNIARTDEALARRFKKDLDLRNSVVDAPPIIKLKREVDKASEAYYRTPEALRDDFLTRNPALNVQRWAVYGAALQSVEAVDMALRDQAEGEVLKAMTQPNFNMPMKYANFSHRIDTDIPTWEKDKKILQTYLDLPSNLKDTARNHPLFASTLVYWGSGQSLDIDKFPSFDQKMSALNWPHWNAARQDVLIWLALPTTNKDKVDKMHIQARSPQIDAHVNMWRMFLYGEQPQFRSEAGRIEYARITGQDTSNKLKFPVVPPQDMR